MATDNLGRDVTPQGLPVGWSDSSLNPYRTTRIFGVSAVAWILKQFGYFMAMTMTVLVLMMVVGSIFSLFR